MIMVLGPHKKKAEARADAKVERDRRAAERAAEHEEEEAERHERSSVAVGDHPDEPKVRRRSEALDPDM